VVGVGRQAGISVEEQQHVAARLLGAHVHLQRTPARCGNHAVGARPRARYGGIAAAAVDHDHLDAERAQVRKRIERASNAFTFIEHRHDDRELRHADLARHHRSMRTTLA
jgi:hypothetical protein